MENAAKVGNFLMEGIKAAPASCGGDVRGRGLMIGVELDVPYKEIRTSCSLRSIASRDAAAAERAEALLPPLCLGEAEAADFLKRLERVVNN